MKLGSIWRRSKRFINKPSPIDNAPDSLTFGEALKFNELRPKIEANMPSFIIDLSFRKIANS